jgi:hypothetical protein
MLLGEAGQLCVLEGGAPAIACWQRIRVISVGVGTGRIAALFGGERVRVICGVIGQRNGGEGIGVIALTRGYGFPGEAMGRTIRRFSRALSIQLPVA